MTRRGFLASIAALVAGRSMPALPGPVRQGPLVGRGGTIAIEVDGRVFEFSTTWGEAVARTSWRGVAASGVVPRLARG